MITHDPSKRRIHVATITPKTTAKVCERKPYCGCNGDIRRNCHQEKGLNPNFTFLQISSTGKPLESGKAAFLVDRFAFIYIYIVKWIFIF